VAFLIFFLIFDENFQVLYDVSVGECVIHTDAVVFFYKIAENKKLKKSLSVKFLQIVTDSDALLFIFLKL
jgi:hypothetical protein